MSMQVAEILLNHGAEVNIQDKTSCSTPLHRAASRCGPVESTDPIDVVKDTVVKPESS